MAKADAPDERVIPLLRAMHAHAASTVLVLMLLRGAVRTAVREVAGA